MITSTEVLDRWVLERLAEVHTIVTSSLDTYDAYTATRVLQEFIVKDVSQWYIRRSRDRVGASSEDEQSKTNFYNTSWTLFYNLSVLLAPFTPFIAEEMYQSLKTDDMPESVHLVNWAEITVTDPSITVAMEFLREIAEKVHAARKVAGIKVRQPLAKISVTAKIESPSTEVLEILKDEVNIKDVEWVVDESSTDTLVDLDTELTEELVQEGIARELTREIQTLRKEAGYDVSQSILLSVVTKADELKAVLDQHKDWIQKKVIASEIQLTELSSFDQSRTIDVNGYSATISVKTI